jgi:hypothetical protein
MNKRQTYFKSLCDQFGLVILDWQGPGNRIGGLVRAPNGRTMRYGISAKAGDAHANENARADLRRFARDNPATAMSQAIAQVAPPPLVHPVPVRVRVHRVAAPQPAAAAPVPPPPSPAPAPTPTPHVAPQPEPAPSTTKATMSKAMPLPGAQNKFSRANFYALTKHLESIDTTAFPTLAALGDAAGKALDVVVPPSTLREAMDILGKSVAARPTKPVSDAAIVARALAELMKTLGNTVPADLAAVAAKAAA